MTEQVLARVNLRGLTRAEQIAAIAAAFDVIVADMLRKFETDALVLDFDPDVLDLELRRAREQALQARRDLFARLDVFAAELLDAEAAR